ncbi:unnamed protein product [Adineta ricciae]|uniref:Uncharacterized protein n=1 Tax=Adineta ricciae TaxID=249248 RepID=A0A815QBC3_ADIRI|nr:unnamed protein product [Adineta ricciae]CAF1645603.1 unnamed protein product [Adineta ricciae]
MTMYSSHMRTDFRCAICQRKNVFHCEHDTPHRDRFLGADIPETSRSFKMDDHIHIHENNTRQRVGSHTSTRHNQVSTYNTNTYQSSQTYQTNQKSKACVIL